jgi:hypothetical protein
MRLLQVRYDGYGEATTSSPKPGEHRIQMRVRGVETEPVSPHIGSVPCASWFTASLRKRLHIPECRPFTPMPDGGPMELFGFRTEAECLRHHAVCACCGYFFRTPEG